MEFCLQFNKYEKTIKDNNINFTLAVHFNQLGRNIDNVRCDLLVSINVKNLG